MEVTYPLVNVVCTELHSRVGYNAYAICSIAGHEPSPALFPPHFRQRLRHRHFVFLAPNALDLEQDLEALEGRNDGSGNGAGHASSHEGSNHRLPKPFSEPLECGGVGCAERLRLICELIFPHHCMGELNVRLHPSRVELAQQPLLW